MIRGSQPQSRESSLKLYHKSESLRGRGGQYGLPVDVHRPRNRRRRVHVYYTIRFSFSHVIENIAALVTSVDCER